MSNYFEYVLAVAKALENNTTLNALVDGQIVPGFVRSMADAYLTETNGACIGVRNLLDSSHGLPGCAFHGTSKHSQLMEIRVITMLTPERQNDFYAGLITEQIEATLKAGIPATIDGIDLNLFAVGNIDFTPLDDDQLSDRLEVQGTIKIGYYG